MNWVDGWVISQLVVDRTEEARWSSSTFSTHAHYTYLHRTPAASAANTASSHPNANARERALRGSLS